MTKTTTFAQPQDPNRCFVNLPKILTAGSVAVSLESLLKQLHKHDSQRPLELRIVNHQLELLFTERYEP
ncbi:hypothetical protein J15TS10_25020 [Paenibacillus woosongensis]|uniref:Uncharacterized protein n=1 Tax=Paenibacillus woosongensis TaxID=307580 RepID=A0ABQ4MRX6_9BACL|nr:hypothetical protein J15TS10_25020 [Paenibacillus woosongensis]